MPLKEELDVDAVAWRNELVSVEALDKELRELAFPDVIKKADQFKEELGKAMSDELGMPPARQGENPDQFAFAFLGLQNRSPSEVDAGH